MSKETRRFLAHDGAYHHKTVKQSSRLQQRDTAYHIRETHVWVTLIAFALSHHFRALLHKKMIGWNLIISCLLRARYQRKPFHCCTCGPRTALKA
jgi:hypothetical protein